MMLKFRIIGNPLELTLFPIISINKSLFSYKRASTLPSVRYWWNTPIGRVRFHIHPLRGRKKRNWTKCSLEAHGMAAVLNVIETSSSGRLLGAVSYRNTRENLGRPASTGVGLNYWPDLDHKLDGNLLTVQIRCKTIRIILRLNSISGNSYNWLQLNSDYSSPDHPSFLLTRV